MLRHKDLWFQGPPMSAALDSKRETNLLRSAPNTKMFSVALSSSSMYDQHILEHMSYQKLRWSFYRLLKFRSTLKDPVSEFRAATGQEVTFETLSNVYLWRYIQCNQFPEVWTSHLPQTPHNQNNNSLFGIVLEFFWNSVAEIQKILLEQCHTSHSPENLSGTLSLTP